LAHIRRHDYLVNVVQSIAEALLFYHPAVWWLSGQIRSEREKCCDDAAVAVSGDVLTYARALMELESCRPAHLNAVLAANGGSLADRIARLLDQSRLPVRSGLGPGLAASAFVLVIASYGLFAQQEARPTFQVASIKLMTEPSSRIITRPLPGGGLKTEKAPVKLLIIQAYRVQGFQVIGGPSWIDSDGYNIEAKPESPTDEKGTWLMLQALLADRFALKVHRETRELPVYELTAAKNGIKVSPPKEGSCVTEDVVVARAPTPGASLVGQCGFPLIGFSGTLIAGKITMADLAKGLASIMGRPVLDHTGFTGEFDVHLQFAPDPATAGLVVPPIMGGSGLAPVSSDSDRPSIFAALQEQLGLRLASTKGPVEVLVIDHVQRPSEN
jgi:uncharacterized protein (TIGR03435 family)